MLLQLKTFDMKFLKWLRDAHNDASYLQKNASGNKPDLDYELCLLDDCKQKRDIYVEDMATLAIIDIDKTIATYEDHVHAFITRGKVIICSIISEKISQLKKARQIVQKRIAASAFLAAPRRYRFEPALPL